MAKLMAPYILDRDDDETANIDINQSNSNSEDSNHVWLFSAVVMIITFKHLCEGGYTFPMRLLVIHITIALATTQLRLSRKDSSMEPRQLGIFTLLCSAVHVAAMAGALIFAYQAILHLPNVILVAMILTLPWPFLDAAALPSTPFGTHFLSELVPRYGLLAACIVCMFLYDNQLYNRGIISSVVAACCVAVLRLSALLGASNSLPGPRSTTVSTHTYGLILALPIAVIVLLAAHEAHYTRAILPSGQWTLFIVNILTGGIALLFGTPFKRLTPQRENMQSLPYRGTWASLTLVMVLTIDNASLRLRPCDMSPWQWLAYALALSACVACTRRTPATHPLEDLKTLELGDDVSKDACNLQFDRNNGSSLHPISHRAPLFYVLCAVPILLVVYHRYLTQPTFSSPVFPASIGSNRTLDIVFARYAEDTVEIADFTEQLLNLPVLQDIDVRVVMYNKGNRTDSFDTLRAVTNDLVVHNVPNIEKEGETYISHLLNQWDDLAHQTLFLQAKPHEPKQLLERVRDYYGPDTGFLALSYTFGFCQSCDRCTDPSTWYEKPEVFHDVYEKANKKPCRNISLTYRGQFIVSKERVHNVGHTFLEETKRKLLNDWTYGYSFERLWGVAFQCPTISSSCPTLDSGSLGHMGSGGRADCQCLDSL